MWGKIVALPAAMARRPWVTGVILLAVMAVLAVALLVRERAARQAVAAPERANDAPPVPQQSSIISVPVDADAAVLRAAIEEVVPHTLWTIDRKERRCIAPQKVKIFGKRINVTPVIGCTIVGVVTRGPIRLRGEGRDIVADMPIHARISARDVAGVLKGETATGDAMAHARIRLDLDANWRPRGKVTLAYGWTTQPGIDFLGHRITFTDKADEKLVPIVRKLEADLPRKLARVNLRREVTPLWRKSFAVLNLNERNPEVWMRVAPRRIIYSGYSVQGRRLRLDLGVEAMTETFVGHRPDASEPGPLPPLVHGKADGQFRFFLPVVADYEVLKPVILRALRKRAQRPFKLPAVGAVQARFDKVEVYGTSGNRIAVGVTLAAWPQSRVVGETKGLIWLTARPVNEVGSPRIRFEELKVTGDSDGVGGDLLLTLVGNAEVANQIAASLTQNFDKDLTKLLGKVKRATESRKEGDFAIGSRIDAVQTGVITAYGQGLYLPVRAEGTARVRYTPGK